MVVVVFRYKPDPAFEQEATALGERMYELGTSMPGFISYKEFSASDGECVAIVEFETHEHLAAWREHTEHRHAQQRGRSALFTEFRIQVCDLVRSSGGGSTTRTDPVQ